MLDLLKYYVKDKSQSTVIKSVVSLHEIVNVIMLKIYCLGRLTYFVYINDIFYLYRDNYETVY